MWSTDWGMKAESARGFPHKLAPVEVISFTNNNGTKQPKEGKHWRKEELSEITQLLQ
jgi:hypothetical protein